MFILISFLIYIVREHVKSTPARATREGSSRGAGGFLLDDVIEDKAEFCCNKNNY